MSKLPKADMYLDLFRSRRSIRFFKDEPIPDKHVMMILEAARWAPSASNAQPWQFIVIKDPKIKKDLNLTMKKVGSAVRKRHPEFPWSTTPRDPKLISTVPVVVAVCADYDIEELQRYAIISEEFKKDLISFSIAAAIQNMMLMATALGVGSLWLTKPFTKEIKQLLHIPERLRLVALMALGYPARHKNKACRRPLETIVHYDKFAQEYTNQSC